MAFNPNEHLTKLKGKDYLEVKWRMVWFREEWPCGTIETEHIELTDERAVFRATVRKVDEDGVVKGVATGTKSETPRGFADYIEKAETGSIGRALAALGFGTQFAPELEEGERIVDSPVQRTPPPQAHQPSQPDAPRSLASSAQRNLIIGKWKALGNVVTGEDGKEHHDADKLNEALAKKYGEPGLTVSLLTAKQAKEVIDGLIKAEAKVANG